METMTVRDFRSNMSACWKKAKAGEQVVVRCGSDLFTIVPIESEDLAVTPSLMAKIEKARMEIKEGKGIRVNTKEELDAYLESL